MSSVKFSHRDVITHRPMTNFLRSRRLGFLVAITLGSLMMAATSSHAMGFECAQLANLHTTPLAADIDNLVPKGFDLQQPDQLASAVVLMREHGLSTDNTINHLIALYCPAIASESQLSEDQKTDQVRRFAANVTRLVLSDNNIEDVLFDVPLSPDLAEEVRQRADLAGLPVEKWIAQIVKATIR